LVTPAVHKDTVTPAAHKDISPKITGPKEVVKAAATKAKKEGRDIKKATKDAVKGIVKEAHKHGVKPAHEMTKAADPKHDTVVKANVASPK